MKGKIIFIGSFLLCFQALPQPQGGMEQYYYMEGSETFTPVPIVHFQTGSNWYAEARYNYEEVKTFSFYAGRVFSKEGRLSYSVTPLLGGVAGKFTGGSAGVHASVYYGNLFFSSQTQYTFSSSERSPDFFFTWSEAGYELTKWMYAALAVQQTSVFSKNISWGEPGAAIGFSFGKWSFPLYSFSPLSDDRYFILGVNLELGNKH